MNFHLANKTEGRLNGSQVGPFSGYLEVRQLVFILVSVLLFFFKSHFGPSGFIIKSSVLYIFIKHLFWIPICISDNITMCVSNIHSVIVITTCNPSKDVNCNLNLHCI